MRLTDIFKFKLFERTDKADLDVVNENFQSVETVLSNCMQPRGIFTGDIDLLRSIENAGAYWVHPASKGTTSATNSFPFDDGENYYDLYAFVKNETDSTQMAIRFNADGKYDVRYRMYANGRWYPWSTALGKTDISSIGDGTITGAIGALLKKSSVVNTNTVTEEGYALDARQANPNVAGSLGAQIDTLNTNLTSHTHSWTTITAQGTNGTEITYDTKLELSKYSSFLMVYYKDNVIYGTAEYPSDLFLSGIYCSLVIDDNNSCQARCVGNRYLALYTSAGYWIRIMAKK